LVHIREKKKESLLTKMKKKIVRLFNLLQLFRSRAQQYDVNQSAKEKRRKRIAFLQ
jgi:hypothetical protein